MVDGKSSIFELCTTKYKIYNYNCIYIYICNLGYVAVLSEDAVNKVSYCYRVCTYTLLIAVNQYQKL